MQAKYDTNVATDKAAFENNVEAYETQLMTNQSQNSTAKPWYHPAGYRYVRHILLPVDTELMSRYTDLQARLEEQMNGDTATAAPADAAAATDTPDPSATAEPTQEPVTQADLDSAKADILKSVAGQDRRNL